MMARDMMRLHHKKGMQLCDATLEHKRRFQMCNRIQLVCAAAGALVALAPGVIAARADELGPVGPGDTILTTFADKRVIAFFQRDNGNCNVNAVVFESSDVDTGKTTAARVRVSLRPHEMIYIDSPDNQTLRLQCGSNARTLEVTKTDKLVVAGHRPTVRGNE
jgi:cystathionine beta-lyase/cystathionine gamma-synthase